MMKILYTYINQENHQNYLSKFLKYFSVEFKEKVLSFRKWEDAQLSLLGRVLLCYGLHKYNNININEVSFDLLSNGKPSLKNKNIHFNISHSNNIVVCIIADYPVGIDVEFLNDDINYLEYKFQMTENEFEKINEADDAIKSFYKYWTGKEAVMKAHGGGMMIPLDSFEIDNDESCVNGEKFYVREVFIDKSYSMHIASKIMKIKNEKVILEQKKF